MRSRSYSFFVLVCVLPTVIVSSQIQILGNCEDEFVRHFIGNSSNTSYIPWDDVRRWEEEDNRMQLHKICNDAHGLKVNGSFFIERVYVKEAERLVFVNSHYKPVTIDVLGYHSRMDERYLPAYAPDYERSITATASYLTLGLKPDCVHYVTPMDGLATQFRLDKHVCGLSW